MSLIKVCYVSCVNTKAVHFLLRDHLDRGFNSTSTYDTLGKNVCEYLVSSMSSLDKSSNRQKAKILQRAKWVNIPNKFLARGRI